LLRVSDSITGVIYISISAFAYATQTILGKFAFAAGLTPESMLLLRYLFTALLLTPYLLFRGLPFMNRSPLVLVQSLLFVLEGLLFFHALQHLPASITIVVFFSHPVLVAILGSMVFKEKLHFHFVLGLLLAVGGVILVSGIADGVGELSVPGLILVILAAVSYTIYSLISQKNVRSISPLTITNTLAIGSLILLLFMFHDLNFLSTLSLQGVSLVLMMTVFNTIIAVVFFLQGIKKLGAAKATLLGTLEPVLAMFLAFSFLGESLSPIQIWGALLVFFSTVLAVYPGPKLPLQKSQPKLPRGQT